MRNSVVNGSIGFLAASLLTLCCIAPYQVTGRSMEKTHGCRRSVVWVLCIRPWLNHALMKTGLWRLRRGDVIFYRVPLDEDTIAEKRIFALPGDVVEVTWRAVMLNGQPVYTNAEALARMAGLFKLERGRECEVVLHKMIDHRRARVAWQVSLSAGREEIVKILSERTACDYKGLVNIVESKGVAHAIRIRVPPKSYFVLGDTGAAYDSRFHGVVAEAAVLQRVIGQIN